MKRILFTLCLVFFAAGFALAQRTVMGTVTGDGGDALIGVSVVVKGTNNGTTTDLNGKYSVNVPAGATTLVFTYTGYQTAEQALGASNVVDVRMATSEVVLQDVVVTALGVSRYKNELAYSAQKVDGADLSATRDANVVNALSGKVAGLDIKRNNNLGGSTNVVLRGSKSISYNNQALFVVDGVPIDNSNTNTANQRTGRLGYDYGNAANDINSDDVESVTVLKGAAATALYGSRAANGVVLITTKKGSKTKGIGVTVNAGANFGTFDPSTFIKYQKEYGGGYGYYYEDPSGQFLYRDIDGDGQEDLVATTSEDASYGAAFNPNLNVYQWDAFDPTSPNFGKARPWVAAANGPESMFQTAIGTNNSVMIDGSNDNGYFKLGYTRTTDRGIMPNSSIDKNLVNFAASYNLSKKFSVFTNVNYTSTDGLGRYGTGYDSKNLMTNFRQWWQTNVDVQEQREAYERTGKNVTWNWADPTDLTPIYWDNPYWTRYENYQNDHRNRYFGYAGATWKVLNWLNVTGRVSLDQYDEIQEERIARGSVDVSQYSRFNRNFREVNYDLMAEIPQREIFNKVKFDGLIGTNIRKSEVSSIRATTNGGLALPGIYALTNTASPLNAPAETLSNLEVDGVFAKVGFVYDGWAILDLTARRDQSSTLPPGSNIYYYPSASLGIIFSEFLGKGGPISFGKLRANYAEVGNDAPPLSIYDIYTVNTPFGDGTSTSVPGTKNNSELKPERTKSAELGLEMRFLKDRVGFDVTVYKQNTINQIVPIPVSRATGFASKIINAGNVENKGLEISAFVRPINTRDFSWRIEANWAAYRNKVVEIYEENGVVIDNILLGSFQGGVSINAALGEPYGTIRGSDYVYDESGNKVVLANGYYKRTTTSNEIIGNVNPDWFGGITNQFRYKNVTLGFQVDVRSGGDVFSLDMYYGLATGLPAETVGKNDLDNPLRNPLGEGGGIILEGVKEDGTPNDKRVNAANYGLFGYVRNPAAGFVYDGSFVKLREVTLDFKMPNAWFGNVLKGASVGLYGRNLWIIHKNMPYADPEDGLSSGNLQGYQVGSYPTARTMGLNLKVRF